MRRPTLHKIFGVSNDSGLSSVLRQDTCLNEAVQSSNIPGLRVLAGGPPVSNPAELLGTPHMRNVLEQLAQEFDMVLLDSPALLAATDAGVLAAMADGVIQVVGYAQSQEDAVRNARKQLAAFKAKLLGVIVNRAEAEGFYSYYHRVEARSYQHLH